MLGRGWVSCWSSLDDMVGLETDHMLRRCKAIKYTYLSLRLLLVDVIEQPIGEEFNAVLRLSHEHLREALCENFTNVLLQVRRVHLRA